MSGDRLRIEFGEAKARAECRVTAKPDCLAFELLSVEGGPIDRIDFLRLNIRRLPHLGQWINAACDDRFGICLRAGNIRTSAEMETPGDHVLMRVTAEPDPGFEGTVALLFGCREPRERLLDAMEVVERDFDLPTGAARRRLPEQRASYLWASRPTPENIGEYIDWAKRGGFRVILFSYLTHCGNGRQRGLPGRTHRQMTRVLSQRLAGPGRAPGCRFLQPRGDGAHRAPPGRPGGDGAGTRWAAL